MTQRFTTYVATVLLLSATSFVFAQESTMRDYEVPNHGRLELLVPKSWREEVRQPAGGLPPTIALGGIVSDSFDASVFIPRGRGDAGSCRSQRYCRRNCEECRQSGGRRDDSGQGTSGRLCGGRATISLQRIGHRSRENTNT